VPEGKWTQISIFGEPATLIKLNKEYSSHHKWLRGNTAILDKYPEGDWFLALPVNHHGLVNISWLEYPYSCTSSRRLAKFCGGKGRAAL